MSASTTTDPSLVEALLGAIESLHASLEQEQAANSDLHADMKRLEEGMGEIKKAERHTNTLYLQAVQDNKELTEQVIGLEKRIDELELEKVGTKRELDQYKNEAPYFREANLRCKEHEENIKQLHIDLLRATTEASHLRANLAKAEDELHKFKLAHSVALENLREQTESYNYMCNRVNRITRICSGHE